jgi:hypothetical protein
VVGSACDRGRERRGRRRSVGPRTGRPTPVEGLRHDGCSRKAHLPGQDVEGRSLRFSTDLEFVGSATAICRLHLTPPGKATMRARTRSPRFRLRIGFVPILARQDRAALLRLLPARYHRAEHRDQARGRSSKAAAPHPGVPSPSLKIRRGRRSVLDAERAPVELHLVMDNYAASKPPNMSLIGWWPAPPGRTWSRSGSAPGTSSAPGDTTRGCTWSRTAIPKIRASVAG